MLLLGVKPRSTPVIILFVPAVTDPVIIMVNVAELVPMSNEYVASGHPELPPPQPVRDSVPTWSALAAPLKANAATRANSKYPSFLSIEFLSERDGAMVQQFLWKKQDFPDVSNRLHRLFVVW